MTTPHLTLRLLAARMLITMRILRNMPHWDDFYQEVVRSEFRRGTQFLARAYHAVATDEQRAAILPVHSAFSSATDEVGPRFQINSRAKCEQTMRSLRQQLLKVAAAIAP